MICLLLARNAKPFNQRTFSPFIVLLASPHGCSSSSRKIACVGDKAGHVVWKENPREFLDENIEVIVKKYRVILDAFRADPQKVAKNEGSYTLVLDAFETELLKRQAAA